MNLVYVIQPILISMMSALPLDHATDPAVVTREEWGAKAPKQREPMPNPVPFVVIHHSYHPLVCHDKEECIKAMKNMQDFHQFERGWNDIGYNFAVGGDGKIYEGRGWSSVGAHAPKYNNKSVGICVIGDWSHELPGDDQLNAVKQLIAMGVENGKIAENYKLVGHRQVRNTECPGEALFAEIQTWPHFTNGNELEFSFLPALPPSTKLHNSTLDQQKPDIREDTDSLLPIDDTTLKKREL